MPQAPAPQGRSVCVLVSLGAIVVKDGCKQTRDSQKGTDRVPGHTAQQPAASGQLRFHKFVLVQIEQQSEYTVSTFQ